MMKEVNNTNAMMGLAIHLMEGEGGGGVVEIPTISGISKHCAEFIRDTSNTTISFTGMWS